MPPKCCDIGLEEEFKVERRFEDDSLQTQRFLEPPEFIFKGDLRKFGVRKGDSRTILFKINDFWSFRNSFFKAIWENCGVRLNCCDVGLEKEFKVERRFEDDSLQNQRLLELPELIFQGDLRKLWGATELLRRRSGKGVQS